MNRREIRRKRRTPRLGGIKRGRRLAPVAGWLAVLIFAGCTDVDAIRQRHTAELETLRGEHADQLKQLEQKHADRLDQVRQSCLDRLDAQRDEHRAEIRESTDQHRREVERLSLELRRSQQDNREQIELLRRPPTRQSQEIREIVLRSLLENVPDGQPCYVEVEHAFDPCDELMQRLQSDRPTLRRISEKDDSGPADEVCRIQIEAIHWVNKNRVQVKAGWRTDALNGAGYLYRVELVDQQWRVTERDELWSS